MHHGSGMSAAGQWNLSQVVPCHSKVFQLSCNMFHCSFADVSLSLSLPSLLPFNTFVELMCEWSVWDLFQFNNIYLFVLYFSLVSLDFNAVSCSQLHYFHIIRVLGLLHQRVVAIITIIIDIVGVVLVVGVVGVVLLLPSVSVTVRQCRGVATSLCENKRKQIIYN